MARTYESVEVNHEAKRRARNYTKCPLSFATAEFLYRSIDRHPFLRDRLEPLAWGIEDEAANGRAVSPEQATEVRNVVTQLIAAHKSER